MIFWWQSWIFGSQHSSVTWSFRNHSDMLILWWIIINYYWCSIINNALYDQCWKPFLLLNIIVETMTFSSMFSVLLQMNEEHLFEIDIFINIFTVTFDQLCHKSIVFFHFYTKHLNGSTSGFQKKKAATVFNILNIKECILSTISSYWTNFWRILWHSSLE